MSTAKRKIALTTTMVALFALLCVLLSACGLFGTRYEVKQVNISISGVKQPSADASEVYIASLGTPVVLVASWDNARVKNPAIQWYLAIGEGEAAAIEGATRASFSYTFDNISDTIYTFSVSVKNIMSENTVKVCADYAQVSAPQITATGDTIVSGTLMRNIAENTQDITLTAAWNGEYINPATTVMVEWYLGDVEQSAGVSADGKTFTFSSLHVAGELSVTAKLVYGQESVQTTLTIVFVEKYQSVANIELNVISGAVINDGGVLYQTANGTDISDIIVSAIALPLNKTDLSSQCTWSLRNNSGKKTLEGGAREMVLTADVLQKGKNIVTASVDNIESANLTIYILSETEYQQRKSVIEDRFVWGNNECDHYILDTEDLGALVAYMVSLHRFSTGYDGANGHNIYLANANWRADVTSAFSNAVSVAVSTYADESGGFDFQFSSDKIWMKDTSDFGIPQYTTTVSESVEQENIYTSLKTNSIQRTEFPIDASKKTLAVYNSNDLYRAVGYGYKPIFENNSDGEKLNALYQKARNVASEYLRDDMSEFEKVRTIYEWIISQIDYDYAAAAIQETVEAITYNAYYLEGVFNDAQAVCDGKSKAFTLLCGIEGIRSMRIIGDAEGGGHAWNKVLIDTDDDGVREWYCVDTTWGDSASATRGGGYTESLSYKYFLVTDDFLAQTHTQRSVAPSAVEECNQYQLLTVDVGDDELVSMYVTSDEQLKKLVRFALDNDVKLIVKVNMQNISSDQDFVNRLGQLKNEIRPLASGSSYVSSRGDSVYCFGF